MGRRALILTYHAVDSGPPPLCISPALFAEHVRRLAACGARTLTMAELIHGLGEGSWPERAVALTFDDGLRSVMDHALPVLEEHGMTATLFCVAGHLGRMNDWPTQPAGTPRMEVAGAADLAQAAAAGFEIGVHGMTHRPLDGRLRADTVSDEVLGAKNLLERLVGIDSGVFAYPYGAGPHPLVRAAVEGSYAGACGTRMAVVEPAADAFNLPRVDAYYLRRPGLLERAVCGTLDPYLTVRRLVRRLLRPAYPAACEGDAGFSREPG